MRYRGQTLLVGLVLLVGLLVAGLALPVPFVAIGRGPTHDALGEFEGTTIIAIATLPTYPTSGHLNMTTVGVTGGLTAVEALALWIAGDQQVVPRSAIAPPEESAEETVARNRQLFVDSQADAEAAALGYLGLPTVVYVGALSPGSPSAELLAEGDALTEIAGRPVRGLDELREIMAGTRPGQQLPVRVQRGDAPPREVVVTLGGTPDGPQGVLGIAPVARPLTEDEIVISLADIGGPSAGLVFALATVDKLTPGALTGGRFVAGTGTIDSGGVVGRIDGIPFKMLAAREAGASIFLVPSGNCEEARSTVPDGLDLVKVDDLAGAVAALELLNAGGTPATC